MILLPSDEGTRPTPKMLTRVQLPELADFGIAGRPAARPTDAVKAGHPSAYIERPSACHAGQFTSDGNGPFRTA